GSCLACVCAADPYCCTTLWDATCAAKATTSGTCGDRCACPLSASLCCQNTANSRFNAGCADGACQQCVCNLRPECCLSGNQKNGPTDGGWGGPCKSL